MKFIRPKYEVLELPEPTDQIGVLKHLERIGRVSYKSEDKITDDSCFKFIEKIRDRKHWAVLEHYIFVISITAKIYNDFINFKEFTKKENPDIQEKIKFLNVTYWKDSPNKRYRYLLSASATSLNYIWECYKDPNNVPEGIIEFLTYMNNYHPSLMRCPYSKMTQEKISRVFPFIYSSICFLSRDEIKNLPRDLRLVHDSISVKYTVNRGVTHELVRHRPCSWLQESTRYVNYGNSGCQFILPLWMSESDKEFLMDKNKIDNLLEFPITSVETELSDRAFQYFLALKCCSNVYERLLLNDENEKGWNPQQARDVLPNATKSDIVQTCSLYEMIHFFNMRVPKSAHPQMREVTVPLLAELGERDPEIFKDQAEKILANI